jgi:hypothetical protein
MVQVSADGDADRGGISGRRQSQRYGQTENKS